MKRPLSSSVFLPGLPLLLIVPSIAFAASTGGQAAVKLLNATATISQTSGTDWKLKKTGEVDSSTVTWTITATEESTTSGHLVVYGFMTVANTGARPATIGNVVNLQSKWLPGWKTQSSYVADPSLGVNPLNASQNFA